MRWTVIALVTAFAGAALGAEVKMEHVGKTYRLDYGQLVIEVKYLSPETLQWEQVKGPEAGSKATESYGFTAVRPGVGFFWWQEKDTSVVTQVVDFEKGRVYTTWTSPDKKLAAFEGTVKPKE
jgi:MoaF-like